jgi:hypothetical protein
MYEHVRFNEKQAYIIQKNGVRRRVYTREENQRINRLADAVSPYDKVFHTDARDTRKSMKLRSGSVHSKKAVSVMHKLLTYKG